jgi:hypothetical protein
MNIFPLPSDTLDSVCDRGATTDQTITTAGFTIGANTLDTNEWAYLDGQNQSVKTAGSPSFVDLTLTAPSAQSYKFTNVGTLALGLQGQASGQISAFELFSKDGDGTDAVYFEIFGKGTPSTTANSESLIMQWDTSSTAYKIWTRVLGSGTPRDLILQIGANTNQLVLYYDGRIALEYGVRRLECGELKADIPDSDPAETGMLYYDPVTNIVYRSTG